jgi:hypothetical protein
MRTAVIVVVASCAVAEAALAAAHGPVRMIPMRRVVIVVMVIRPH